MLKSHISQCRQLSKYKGKLDLDVIEPKKKATDSTIIWMHGLGDSSEGFKYLFENMISPMLPSTRIILPNAPMRKITCNNGAVMRGWYDIKSIDRLNAELDYNGLKESCEMVHEILDAEFSQVNTVICGGFSQGAVTALNTVLTYPKEQAVSALVCCSGYSMYNREKTPIATKEKQLPPLYIFHGQWDNVVPYKYAMQTYDELFSEISFNKEFIIDKHQGHEVTEKQISELVAIFRRHLPS